MRKQYYSLIDETLYSAKLENGLSVYLLPRADMSKAYGIFTTNYGSIDRTFIPIEQKEKITVPDGVAHFLEHKLFEKEDRDVFTDFSNYGASVNAYTSFSKTAYLFSATNQIEKNVEILLDFVQDPYFSDASVEKEKGIIAQEIKMYDDQPNWRSFMGTIQALFHSHPITIDIAGTVESISSITKEDLYTCYNTFYHPENMILFIAGRFDVEDMFDLIQQNQAKKTFPTFTAIAQEYPDEPQYVKIKEKVINMPVSVPKCTVGIKESTQRLKGEAFLKKDLLKTMLLEHYFAQGGDCFEMLYDAQLIDDSFSFQSTLDKNYGYSLISSNTENPELFAQKVTECLMSLQKQNMTEEAIERMKRKKIGQLLRSMNSLEYIANNYIHYTLQGIDFFKMIPAIQAISRDDIDHFLQNWITEERLAVCTIMPQ
ncbi:MAG TPA: pitrilysin family protein [Cerasibacillus sp.]|uniref:EF-P 5-aminopentanol modification-associated protein YfmH n=1 Tax=Cerasibacillus sp. TaxID=2498711 RepID=UPI002F3F24FF